MAKKDERPASLKAFHDQEIARMYYRERKTQTAIGEALGIHQSTVSLTLQRLRKVATRNAMKDTAAWQGEQLLEIKQIKDEAWKAWFDSLGERKTVAVKDDINGHSVTTTTEKLLGNPAYLAEVRRSVMAEQKVLGLDKPSDVVLSLPPEVIAMLQALNIELPNVKENLIAEIKSAFDARYVTK